MRTRRSLIDLDSLTPEEFGEIFSRAARFERERPGALLAGTACANLFFEQSTRTFTSFNLAQQRLGAMVVNLSPKDLSLATKGESVEDTAITLAAMGIDVLVIRHFEEGFAAQVARWFDGHVVNAGDGAHAHPTQGLLDIFTLVQEFGSVERLRVAIVGDVAHSRVAHSTLLGLLRLGADVTLVGPPELVADDAQKGVRVERDFDRALRANDAIVLLRLQRERFDTSSLREADYIANYQLNRARLDALAARTVVMHPGPYNRGVELDESVLQFAGWRYTRQVRNGVYVRMAVLDFLVNG